MDKEKTGNGAKETHDQDTEVITVSGYTKESELHNFDTDFLLINDEPSENYTNKGVPEEVPTEIPDEDLVPLEEKPEEKVEQEEKSKEVSPLMEKGTGLKYHAGLPEEKKPEPVKEGPGKMTRGEGLRKTAYKPEEVDRMKSELQNLGEKYGMGVSGLVGLLLFHIEHGEYNKLKEALEKTRETLDEREDATKVFSLVGEIIRAEGNRLRDEVIEYLESGKPEDILHADECRQQMLEIEEKFYGRPKEDTREFTTDVQWNYFLKTAEESIKRAYELGAVGGIEPLRTAAQAMGKIGMGPLAQKLGIVMSKAKAGGYKSHEEFREALSDASKYMSREVLKVAAEKASKYESEGIDALYNKFIEITSEYIGRNGEPLVS